MESLIVGALGTGFAKALTERVSIELMARLVLNLMPYLFLWVVWKEMPSNLREHVTESCDWAYEIYFRPLTLWARACFRAYLSQEDAAPKPPEGLFDGWFS